MAADIVNKSDAVNVLAKVRAENSRYAARASVSKTSRDRLNKEVSVPITSRCLSSEGVEQLLCPSNGTVQN